jgi:hypothetical protein
MRGDNMRVRGCPDTRWWAILAIGMLVLAACGGGDEPAATVSVPTSTLIPPTATPTPHPATSTPTPTDLPGPAMLETAATQPAADAIPLAAQTLITQTMTDLMAKQDVFPEAIRLTGLEEFIWRTDGWDCQLRSSDAVFSGPTPGYRILFNVGSRVFVYHTDTTGTFFQCRDEGWLALEGRPVMIDPIAEAMVELVARDAARVWQVEADDLTLVSLLTVNWPDSSVGCPKPGGEYDDALTPGYRIVLDLDDARSIYHTSVRHFVRCLPEEEILPGMLRRAVPTPTLPVDETS